MEENNNKILNNDINTIQQSTLKIETDESNIIKYNIRDRINVMKKFEELKKKKDVNLIDLEELLEHDNTNEEYIEYYLDIISKKYKELLNDKLIFYYPMISPKVYEKFNINKKISEKNRFYDLFKKISDAKNKEELYDIVQKEFQFPSELNKIKI